MIGEHDRLVKLLEDRLDKSPIGYDVVKAFTEYRNGEIDLYAIKGHYLLLFEAKCHRSHKQHLKAKSQLKHHRNAFKLILEGGGASRDYITRIWCFEVNYKNNHNDSYRIQRV